MPSKELCLRLQRGCGMRGWGRDGLGAGARGRGSRPETSVRSRCSGGTTGKCGSTRRGNGSRRRTVAHVAAREDARGGSRPARAGVRTRPVSSARNRQRAAKHRATRGTADRERSKLWSDDLDAAVLDRDASPAGDDTLGATTGFLLFARTTISPPRDHTLRDGRSPPL